MTRNIGSESYISELHEVLKKDAQCIFNKNKYPFKLFTEVGEIYSYGFSFSDVDMVYIKEICSTFLTENIRLYIDDYESEKIDFFKEKIINCGFKGEFDMFTE